MSEEENLRKFLESDDPALVRMGISLAKGAGVEVTVKDLEHFLKSKDVEIIKMGFTFAEEVGVGDEAMEMLCEALGREDKWIPKQGYIRSRFTEMVCATAEALGNIGDERAVEPLIKALGDDNEDVRKAVATALVRIGEAAVEPLIKALGDEEGNVRWAAAWALGEFGAENYDEDAEKDDDGIRVSVDARAVEPLIKALEDEDESVRLYAAWALGNIGDERAVEPLIKALRDEDVRMTAEKALRKLGLVPEHEVE